jgi:hypothetical protein
MRSARSGDFARTVAVRGASVSTPISPGTAFGPSNAMTNWPLFVSASTSASPSRMTYAQSAASPWRISISPGAKHLSSLVNASSFNSDADSPPNSGTLRSISASCDTSTSGLLQVAGRRHAVGARPCTEYGIAAPKGKPR